MKVICIFEFNGKFAFMNQPLAERIRPQKLEDYVSQQHLVGEEGALTKHIEKGLVPSLILWGPPGIGKTTLANIIAKTSDRPFYQLSAINSGVNDVREVLEKANKSGGLFTAQNPILFIDEIHRFSKSQQDSLLGAVEKGTITLIGATTENPSFEVIPALLSRCQVYVLNSFTKDDLVKLLEQSMVQDEFVKSKEVKLKEVEALLSFSGGDARKLLNAFELIIETEEPGVEITNKLVTSKIQKNSVRYDNTGEQHYDIISALIKSIRGSDPNAAVYWLARMIAGGEDLRFIARRLLIAASEDIGNANPMALVMATNTFSAVEKIGNPESRILLSQCVIYLANSPKSNSAYSAINQALNVVKQTGDLAVPTRLRNAPTALMKELQYGDGYKYSHDYSDNFIQQEFMPDETKRMSFYKPGDNEEERATKELMEKRWGKKYRLS